MASFLPDLNDIKELALTTAANSGLPTEQLLKDYIAMAVLASIAKAVPCVVFKGGTSLSKGWNIIDRFSEDLDLLLQPSELLEAPEPASKSGLRTQRSKAIGRFLRDASAAIASDSHANFILEPLRNEDGRWNHNDSSMHTLRVTCAHDFSISGQADFLRDFVRIDVKFGKPWLATERKFLQSYCAETLDVPFLATFPVKCFDPRETLCEKIASLASRLTERPEDFPVRHVYDIHQLLKQESVHEFVANRGYIAVMEKFQERETLSLGDFREASPKEFLSNVVDKVTHALDVKALYEAQVMPMLRADRPKPALDEILEALRNFPV